VVLFGQSRAYHEVAIAAASSLGLSCVVLEDGYFRPGFITMELGGVNGNSTTLDNVEVAADSPWLNPLPTKHPFLRAIYFAGIHYGAMLAGHWRFKHYEHHRERSPLFYLAYWHHSWLRKHLAKRKDALVQNKLLSSRDKYFFVPLQFEGDAQLRKFSAHGSIFEFLRFVLQSFASHVPEGRKLVFKEHPHGRGTGGYHQFLKQAGDALGITQRIIYFVEGDAPLLVQHSAGLVTVNSTVGLRALQYGVPLYVAGTAVYKRQGLHFQGTLDSFWTLAQPAPQAVAENFLLQLRNLTQLPTCLYAGRELPLSLEPTA
jgi:capsular polysaccharide export protein